MLRRMVGESVDASQFAHEVQRGVEEPPELFRIQETELTLSRHICSGSSHRSLTALTHRSFMHFCSGGFARCFHALRVFLFVFVFSNRRETHMPEWSVLNPAALIEKLGSHKAVNYPSPPTDAAHVSINKSSWYFLAWRWWPAWKRFLPNIMSTHLLSWSDASE